jgi:thiazole/oxazole-forming peptide maturase SagD family component
MQLAVGHDARPLRPATRTLLRRMLCPMSGLAQSVGFAHHGSLEPRVAVAGGDMTGVHLLAGRQPPREGAYHIGGSGTQYEEVVIRTLGETIERYAQFLPAPGPEPTIATAEELALPIVADERFRFFSSDQLERPGFPFSALAPGTPVGWVTAESLTGEGPCWIPAQPALVGYARAEHEPQYAPGVTTGTAAHTGVLAATRNALLELIQIDAAVGHWYGHGEAVAIGSDARTGALERLLARLLRDGGPRPRFYWLRSADLPGFAVACVLEWDELPRCAVGLGCELGLADAMYKAFLESAAVAQLAKVILFRQATAGVEAGAADPDAIYDLDTNVAYYAVHGDEPTFRERFAEADPVAPSSLPRDAGLEPADAVRTLVAAFRDSSKRLAFLDLTSADVRELGFCVVRVWTPDLLSLPLPSAPPLEHPRFAAYGGAVHDRPHPYP